MAVSARHCGQAAALSGWVVRQSPMHDEDYLVGSRRQAGAQNMCRVRLPVVLGSKIADKQLLDHFGPETSLAS